MTQNIIEYYRECAVKKLFNVSGFSTSFPIWKKEIDLLTPSKTPREFLDLGDHLKDIFYLTNTSSERNQSDVSGGGANWEGLLCWYLNLCNAGRRTVIIKHSKALIPPAISDAITVKYGTFPSNSESDLLAITFPKKKEYLCDKESIKIKDEHKNDVKTHKRKNSKYNLLPILNALTIRDFKNIEIHIIQCKTNWNDNAQIPMLWDAVYSADSFRNDITVGNNGYSIKTIRKFTYSFVTVPTVKLEKIKPNSVCVLRVNHLSGGNYWGLPSKAGIANSIKEIFNKNFHNSHSSSHLETIEAMIKKLNSTYSYFNI